MSSPEHEMEKVLFACDELTGLIGACAKMRPSGSITDMDLKSLKKKYKSKGFARAVPGEVIAQGADMLGWELDDLLSRTLEVMKPDEAADCRGGRGAVKKVHWGFAPNPGNRIIAFGSLRFPIFATLNSAQRAHGFNPHKGAEFP